MKSNLITIGHATMALLAGAVAPFGCDDGLPSAAPSSSVASVSLDQFPGRYAQAVCAQDFKCCSAADIDMRTMAVCIDDSTTGLMLLGTLVTDGQTKNRVAYDGAKMATCISAVSQLTCDDWKAGFTLTTNQPSACKAAIVPKVPAKGACQADVECVTAHCEGADLSASPPVDGMCTSLAAAGASCTGGLTCADGLYCEEVSLKCVARKPAGKSCKADEECMNTCNVVTGLCSAYAGCAMGDGTPRPGAASVALLAAAAMLIAARARRRARSRPVR